MRIFLISIGLIAVLLSAQSLAATQVGNDELKQQVVDAERAFAKTMADRDHAAFSKFIAEDAIFFSGKLALHGSEAVIKAWRPYYDATLAPFSWAPETVEVLSSGNLALSSGPVKDLDGKVVATFTSIWRLDAAGRWQVVFDKGADVCICAAP